MKLLLGLVTVCLSSPAFAEFKPVIFCNGAHPTRSSDSYLVEIDNDMFFARVSLVRNGSLIASGTGAKPKIEKGVANFTVPVGQLEYLAVLRRAKGQSEVAISPAESMEIPAVLKCATKR